MLGRCRMSHFSIMHGKYGCRTLKAIPAPGGGSGSWIGIGGRLTAPPLPHNRAYGSVHGGSTKLSLSSEIESGEAELAWEGASPAARSTALHYCGCSP